MKKRILALLLSVALCFSLIATAGAVYIEIDENGSGMVSDGTTPEQPNPPEQPEQPEQPQQPQQPNTGDDPLVTPPTLTDSTGGTGTKPSQQPAKDPAEEPAEEPGEEPAEPAEPTEPSVPAMSFIDVNGGDWFYGAVQYVFEKGIMTGDGSVTTFNPKGNMTRAMVWTVLGRLSGADVSGTGGSWYAKAQSWAISAEVSDGTNPNGSITREELVTMLWRYAGSPAASADLSVFSDGASVSSWANAAVQWAVSTGILQGSNNRLNPGSSATRAEVAAILMRYCEIIAG